MYKMETFKVAVLFVLLRKKRRRRKRKAYTLDKRYFFIRATKEANSVCSMYEHEHESFHHNFQDSAKFDCIAQQGWTCNGDNPICARAVTIRDSKPVAFLLNPGFGFGKPQNPGFGSGSGLVRVWENGDCIQVQESCAIAKMTARCALYK